jgi:DNA-binding transcriptional MerR regulator
MTKTANDEYGIGAVSRLTGLSDHTIRAWERRYRAVVAERSASGRRVYRTADVEKLRLLKLLTDRGVAISQVAAESAEELKLRLASMDDISVRAGLDELSVALLGDFLPARVRDRGGRVGSLTFAIAETDPGRFEADLARQKVDAVVIEIPTIAPDTLETVQRFRELSGAEHCVLVYTFGRSRDAEALTAAGVTLLRAPVRLDEIAMSLVKIAALAPLARDAAEAAPGGDAEIPPADVGTLPPRRYSADELAALSGISSDIDCECPQHLASLVAELTAFEIYSAGCASRDDDDRALHEYLHRTTAAARASIEEALARVVEAEGIRILKHPDTK